jgi:hypothetical protein
MGRRTQFGRGHSRMNRMASGAAGAIWIWVLGCNRGPEPGTGDQVAEMKMKTAISEYNAEVTTSAGPVSAEQIQELGLEKMSRMVLATRAWRKSTSGIRQPISNCTDLRSWFCRTETLAAELNAIATLNGSAAIKPSCALVARRTQTYRDEECSLIFVQLIRTMRSQFDFKVSEAEITSRGWPAVGLWAVLGGVFREQESEGR